MRNALAGALALLLFAGTASAQDGRDRDDRHAPPREHVFKVIDSYFIGNLKTRLDLTDEELTRLVPQVKRQLAHRRELAQRRFRATMELRQVLLSGTATEAAVQEILREVKAVEVEEPAALRRDRDAIDTMLTPVQQAKYRLLEAEVERRVRHALSRSGAGGRGRGGREGRPPGRKPRE